VVGLSRFLACLLVAAVLATVGGALFDLLHGGTSLAVSIAYGFWIAAAVVLLGMAGAASKWLARRLHLPFVESWLFITASGMLTGIGVVIDILGE
jgi:hypothetical protein